MKTVITSKFQTTIPKEIREKLSISVHDTLEWNMENGRIIVTIPRKEFLKYKNSIRVGAGDIKQDIEQARMKRAGRYA